MKPSPALKQSTAAILLDASLSGADQVGLDFALGSINWDAVAGEKERRSDLDYYEDDDSFPVNFVESLGRLVTEAKTKTAKSSSMAFAKDALTAMIEGGFQVLDDAGTTSLIHAAPELYIHIATECHRLGRLQGKMQSNGLQLALDGHQFRADIVRACLDAGIDPNYQDMAGDTALHNLFNSSALDRGANFQQIGPIVAMLMQAGADLTLENQHMETPEDLIEGTVQEEMPALYQQLRTLLDGRVLEAKVSKGPKKKSARM